jgi:hypothetical protein
VEVLSDDLTFATTATGPIGLEPAYMSTALPDIAWLGLQELHNRALGLPGGDSFFAHGAQELTPDEAYGLWSAGTIGVLGQIGVTDPVAGDRLLGSLTEFAGVHGSFDGLESPYLSAFNSAMRDPMSSASLNPAGDMWQEVGLPGQLGGGAQTAPIINPATGQLVLPNLQQLGDCIGPNAPTPTPTSLSGLIDAGLTAGTAKLAEGMRDLFAGPHPGMTASGQPSAIPTTNYNKVAIALVEWGAGTVAAGLAAGPLAAVGAFIVGLFNFLTALGSSGDPPAAVQPPGPDSQGKQAAEGKCAVVAQTPVTTKQGAPTAMDKNGTPHPTGPGTSAPSGSSAPSGPPPPPEKKVPTPSEPAKCWRDEDGSLNADFTVPYWQNTIVMSPAFIPVGPGLDSFVMNIRADVAHLAALPTLDAAGEVETASFLSSALVSSGIRVGVG